MKSVYLVFAHPQRQRSRANATILERIEGLPGVTICDLYERYPDFHIDVEFEKAELLKHDVIFLQHPMFWYSMPPLLKLWFDEVFELGFAYGEGGTALKGKVLHLSATAGGPQEAYSASGYNRFSIRDLTLGYDQTANLCGMVWPDPVILYGSDKSTREQIEAHAEVVRDALLRYTNPSYHPGAQS